VGLTYRADGSCFTWGLGLLAVAGFTSSYPASTTNPALMPQPPVGVGLGRLEGRAEILQLVPTVACQLTPRLHVGFAPTLTMARLAASPAVLAPPDDANGDGFPTYGSGSGTRYHWGGGFQVGAYYETDAGLNFGISFKSPQWMETFRVHGEDELGLPRLLEFDLDYPLIVTFGTSYSWCPEWLVACDVRFFNYAATDGFGPEGFGPDGALQGLGWNDIWSVHLAAQRIVNDRLTLRVAYSYNDTPITSETAFYNAISPLITQHIISAGASINVTCCFAIHLTYAYGVENSVSGPWVHPQMGPLDGTSLESTISAHALDIGASVRF
jgi:long-chain fatty acid transport protein